MAMNPRLLRPLARPSLLLDAVPGAAAAYSLRRLRSAHGGSVVTVRRSSDNAEAEFKAAEIEDGTLAAWVGVGNDGFVKTWHDQSGNSNDATNTTAAEQPKIVAGGALVSEGGKAALEFDGVDDYLLTANIGAFQASAGIGLFAVFAKDSASTSDAFSSTNPVYIASILNTLGSPADAKMLWRILGGRIDFTRRNAADSAYLETRAASHLVAASQCLASTVGGLSAALYLNGSALALTADQSGDSLSSSNSYVYLGSQDGSTRFFDGTISELLVYPTDQTALRQRIEGYLAWTFGLQSQLPYDHPYARSFAGFGSQALPSDPDAQTYLAAVSAADGTGVEVGVANAVDDFVKGCKSDGIWDAIKASCILAGARTLAGALVPLRGVAPTNNNFVSGDYDRATGLVGNGTDTYLDSNRAGNADPQDDVHFSVYQTAATTQGGAGSTNWFPVPIGAGTGNTTGTRNFGADAAGDNGTVRNTSATTDAITGIRTASGFIGTSRENASDYLFRLSGSTSSPFSRASETPISGVNFAVFRALGGTAPNNVFYSGRLAFYSIGEALDLEALDTRVSALITAIGAAI